MEQRHQRHEDVVQPRDLPHDVITQNILTRLPIKPLLRFKSISKQWYSTISSPQFGHTHFKFPHPSSPTESFIIHQSNNKFKFLSYDENDDENAQVASKCKLNSVTEVDFDVGDEKLVLVGSCNGLVCLGSTSGCVFIIWNPITREFQKYSDSEICEDFRKECTVTWGFGYVSAVDDYKIVRIRQLPSPVYRVYVFSMKLNKWRRIGEETDDFPFLEINERLRKPGVLVNETLYWMDSGVPSMTEKTLRKIVSFDLAFELFDTFPHLDVRRSFTWASTWRAGGDEERCFDRFLFVLKGCLSKYASLYFSGGVITISKHPGDTKEIIILNALAHHKRFGNLIGFANSYKVFKLDGPDLAIIDLNSQPVSHTPLINFEGTSEIGMSSYSPTLVSLHHISTTTDQAI